MHSLLAVLAVALVAAAPRTAPPPPPATGPVPVAMPRDPGDFTRRMAEEISRASPGMNVTVAGPLQLRVEERDATINLDRVYNFCAANTPADCALSVSSYVAAIRESVHDAVAPVRREQLRIMVRGDDYCAAIRGRVDVGGPPIRPVTRVAAPGLCAILVVDFPRTMRIAAADDLQALSLDADAAWDLALRQTLAAVEPILDNARLEDGLISLGGADYIPSLMLAHEAWTRAVARHGDLFVVVPEDGAVIAIPARPGDVTNLRRAARAHFESAERGISASLYRWTGDRWAVVE